VELGNCVSSGIWREEVDEVNVSLRRPLIMDDQLLMPELEETFSISISTFGVDE